ncbi:hypothetical protein MMC07_004417 [Pseudocyphellaria aurata]|nr:hypothetical protein [Pseudocyphellaria aurata]
METDVPWRVSDDVTREDEGESKTETASVSPLRTHSSSSPDSETKHYSSPTRQSAPKRAKSAHQQSVHQQSSSIGINSSITSHHQHRNNSTTVSPPPTNRSLGPRLSEIPSPTSQRPSSPPSPVPSVQSLSTGHSSCTPSSYFASLSGAFEIDPRTPPTKRQPASRSSHGIDTATGPPPALITRRSYTAESVRKHPTPTDVAAARPHWHHRSETETSIDSVIHLAWPTDEKNSAEPSKATSRARREAERARDNMAAATAASGKSRASLEDDQDSTLRHLDRMVYANAAAPADEPGFAANGHGEEPSETTQEDLLLMLARSNSVNDHATDPAAKNDRRRSRTSNFTPRPSHAPLPPTNGRPSSSGRRFPGHVVSSSQDAAPSSWAQSAHPTDSGSPAFAKRSSTRERRYAASAHPLGSEKRGSQSVASPNGLLTTSRMRSGSTRETSPELPAAHAHRQSLRDSSPGSSPRAYRQSNLSYATNGHYDSSPIPNPAVDQGKRSQIRDGEGTESTVSTTAPSTIWDEVEDLKHRMRKLELTGKMPLSSDAAMSNVFAERPPTATTTMTTISSSPKHGRADGFSPGATTVRGPETAELHPLLHEALAKSKPFIDPNIYMALEATASDALALAAMTAPRASQAAPPATTIDRRLRRKADSMCRSLTELCIAITTEKSDRDSPNSQPHRRHADRSISIHHDSENGQEPTYRRSASEDPELRSGSRVLNRLEARRASLLNSNTTHSPRSSPREANTPTQSSTSPLTTSRLDRPSRRATLATDHSGERPTSRAITEVAHFRPSPSSAERPRREYTSQHPLPTPSQLSPSVPSPLPMRRTFFSAPSMQSPSTPPVRPNGKIYLDRGPTPPKPTGRAAEVRRERMASFGGAPNGNGNGNEGQRGTARVARQMASDTSS